MNLAANLCVQICRYLYEIPNLINTNSVLICDIL
jgi:hypothetical protein